MERLTADEIAGLYESCDVVRSSDAVADLRRLCDVYGAADPSEDSRTANIASLALDVLAPRLLDEVERARALLKRIEWGLLRDECPACGGAMEHKPGCELAALLPPS